LFGLVFGRRDQALALVVFNGAAMLTREGLELDDVEAAARNDEPLRPAGGAGRRHRRHDVVDVVLDVDPGLFLEFLLP